MKRAPGVFLSCWSWSTLDTVLKGVDQEVLCNFCASTIIFPSRSWDHICYVHRSGSAIFRALATLVMRISYSPKSFTCWANRLCYVRKSGSSALTCGVSAVQKGCALSPVTFEGMCIKQGQRTQKHLVKRQWATSHRFRHKFQDGLCSAVMQHPKCVLRSCSRSPMTRSCVCSQA